MTAEDLQEAAEYLRFAADHVDSLELGDIPCWQAAAVYDLRETLREYSEKFEDRAEENR